MTINKGMEEYNAKVLDIVFKSLNIDRQPFDINSIKEQKPVTMQEALEEQIQFLKYMNQKLEAICFDLAEIKAKIKEAKYNDD